MKSTTLGDVAALAGVSKATASKVFNRRSDVADATRIKVVRAASTLGYVPATRTQEGDSPEVWVTIDTLANHYAATVLDGLLDQAADLDVRVLLARGGGTNDRTPHPGSPEWITEACQQGAGAFIMITTPVTAAHLKACNQRGTPLVVIDPKSHPPTGTMTVGATNWYGGVQATEHLLDLGHRRIACVGAEPDSTPGDERLAGFRSAMTSAGVPVDPDLIRPGTFNFADGMAVTDLLTRPDRPTAIFAMCDAVALGALAAARKVGLRVPEDLSVVGFDDSYAALSASPELTTVRQPLTEMGRLALRTAIAAINGEATAPPLQLATTLIERASTGPAPQLRTPTT